MEKDPEKALILEISGRQFKINMIECSRECGQHILKATQRELQQR